MVETGGKYYEFIRPVAETKYTDAKRKANDNLVPGRSAKKRSIKQELLMAIGTGDIGRHIYLAELMMKELGESELDYAKLWTEEELKENEVGFNWMLADEQDGEDKVLAGVEKLGIWVRNRFRIPVGPLIGYWKLYSTQCLEQYYETLDEGDVMDGIERYYTGYMEIEDFDEYGFKPHGKFLTTINVCKESHGIRYALFEPPLHATLERQAQDLFDEELHTRERVGAYITFFGNGFLKFSVASDVVSEKLGEGNVDFYGVRVESKDELRDDSEDESGNESAISEDETLSE